MKDHSDDSSEIILKPGYKKGGSFGTLRIDILSVCSRAVFLLLPDVKML